MEDSRCRSAKQATELEMAEEDNAMMKAMEEQAMESSAALVFAGFCQVPLGLADLRCPAFYHSLLLPWRLPTFPLSPFFFWQRSGRPLLIGATCPDAEALTSDPNCRPVVDDEDTAGLGLTASTQASIDCPKRLTTVSRFALPSADIPDMMVLTIFFWCADVGKVCCLWLIPSPPPRIQYLLLPSVSSSWYSISCRPGRIRRQIPV